MSHSAKFSEPAIAIEFRGNIGTLLEEYPPSPDETNIPEIPLQVITEKLGKEKHRHYAEEFDKELRAFGKRAEAFHWELGGLIFWWDYGKLWHPYGYSSLKAWHDNSDWLPYGYSQISKFRYAYEGYIYRLALPKRKPETMAKLLSIGNIDKAARVVTYMVDDNVDEFVEIMPESTVGQMGEYHASMYNMAKSGIEPRDMTPRTVSLANQIVGATIKKSFDAIALSEIDLDDIFGDMDRDAIVKAKFEGDSYKRIVTVQDLSDPRLKRNRKRD